MANFFERLGAQQKEKKTFLCLGLDPQVENFPVGIPATEEGAFEFLSRILDATSDFICAIKPQVAHFAARGWERTLERLIQYTHQKHPQLLVVLDSKRGDIGSTAELYAQEAFKRYGADAVTINPYLGAESVQPFLRFLDRGVFVLCRTSNPGAGELQNQILQSSNQELYKYIADKALKDWNTHHNLGLVVGATALSELQELRQRHPGAWFLIPGIGTQGGDLRSVVSLFPNGSPGGALINSSRAILYASQGSDFARAAAQEAERMHQVMAKAFQ